MIKLIELEQKTTNSLLLQNRVSSFEKWRFVIMNSKLAKPLVLETQKKSYFLENK